MMLLVSLSLSFGFCAISRLALTLSGTALAIAGEVPASPFSVTLTSDSSGSSAWDHSPAIIGGKRPITILGVAETEENSSIDSSYFF